MNDDVAALTAHSSDLLRYFRRRVPDHDAPDLLAETLTIAWRRIRLLPAEPVAARMWLFGIAHHVLHNHTRSERRRSRLGERLRETLATSRPAPETDAGIEVRDAVDRLPSHLRELVRLVHWDGFTVTQAANIMQIPASTARNHYQRAKAKLRTALEPTATPASTARR